MTDRQRVVLFLTTLFACDKRKKIPVRGRCLFSIGEYYLPVEVYLVTLNTLGLVFRLDY